MKVGAKSDDGEKAWSSMNDSILSGWECVKVYTIVKSVLYYRYRTLIDLAQHSTNKGSSHRRIVASSHIHYSIWFSYIARLSQWGGRFSRGIIGYIEYQTVCPFVGIGTLACEVGSGKTQFGRLDRKPICSNCFYPAFAMATGVGGERQHPVNITPEKKLSHFGQKMPGVQYTHIAARGQTAAYLSEPERTAKDQ